MDGISAKLLDALSMFWSSLDERERRLLLLGVAYLAAVAVWAPLERRRRLREREELIVEISRRAALEVRNG